jgi:hypothetical protein
LIETKNITYKGPFNGIIALLQYLSHVARSDISWTINKFPQHVKSIGLVDWKAAKQILRFVHGKKTYNQEEM